MTFSKDETVAIPPGDYRRESICLALVGDRKVTTQWAVRAVQLQYLPNCKRSLLCFPHPNLDVSRNFSIQQTVIGPPDLRSSWLVLLAAESFIRWDAIMACVTDGSPVSQIGETYVIRRDAVKGRDPPWFVGGRWQGSPPTDRSDLQVLPDDVWRTVDPATQTESDRREAAKIARKMIAFCIPTLGHTSMAWVGHGLQLFPVLASTGCLLVAQGHEVGQARDQLVSGVLALDPTPEYVLFYGDDNLPPPNGLQLLFETIHTREALAVSGLYYMKQSPPDLPVIWRDDTAGPPLPGRDFQIGDVIACDGSGLDFALFRTEALRSIPRPRFRTVVDWVKDKGLIVQTEDAYFWERWRKVHGSGPLVDTRCRVGHYSAADGSVYGLAV